MTEDEVEIARIEIRSTTHDVTSVYARREGGHIHYRVVDEYGGDTLSGANELDSAKPLTLGELEEFFMGSWPLLECLESNFEGDTGPTRGSMRNVRVFRRNLALTQYELAAHDPGCSVHTGSGADGRRPAILECPTARRRTRGE